MPLPLAGAAIGLTPAVISYMHGRHTGHKDPSKGGLGGSVGWGVLANPLSGLTYGLGHRHGRDAAVDNALSGDPSNIRQGGYDLRRPDLLRDPKGRQLVKHLENQGYGKVNMLENINSLQRSQIPSAMPYTPLMAEYGMPYAQY